MRGKELVEDYLIEEGFERIEKKDIPEGVIPLELNGEIEVSELEKDFKLPYFSKAEFLQALPFGLYEEMTDRRTVFRLSKVGGKIISEVKYSTDGGIGPYLINRIHYHDVYADGVYGFQRINVSEKRALNNKTHINVYVRGSTEVYVNLGGYGDLYLKTYRFEDNYNIYPNLRGLSKR